MGGWGDGGMGIFIAQPTLKEGITKPLASILLALPKPLASKMLALPKPLASILLALPKPFASKMLALLKILIRPYALTLLVLDCFS
jgi:hypothetical protein